MALASAAAGVRDYTATLPTELLLLILDGFTFDELRPLLALSSRWRQIALNHEAYWSSVELCSGSDGAINIFLTRLSHTRQRSFLLRVDIEEQEDARQLAAKVFPVVRGCLYHVAEMSILLPGESMTLFVGLMNIPAPSLVELRMCAYLQDGDPEPIVPVLLPDFLGGDAPLLDIVHTFNIYFPSRPVAAFSRTTEAHIVYERNTQLPDLFRHFPSAHTLDLPPTACYDNPVYHKPLSYRNIEHCIFVSGDEFVLPLEAVRDVPRVVVYDPSEDEMRELLAQLAPPLFIFFGPEIYAPDAAFELTVAGRRVGHAQPRWRGIVDATPLWRDHPEMRDAFGAAIAGKAKSLVVDVACWQTLAGCMPPLPGLRNVQINVAAAEDVPAEPAPLALPDLASLEVMARGPLVMPPSTLTRFFSGIFRERLQQRGRVPVHLRLTNIQVLGGVKPLSTLFTSVSVAEEHDTPLN